MWVQVPSRGLAGFESQARFWWDLSPSYVGSCPTQGSGWVHVPAVKPDGEPGAKSQEEK